MRTVLLSKSDQIKAASIAAFVGDQSPAHVQATAQRLFRAVPLDRVRKKDIVHNTRDRELFETTVPAALGDVDAFVSYSWHDNSHLQWKHLQAFRTDFKRVHGREPLVWIDKYCLDQHDPKDGLMCLPVFLGQQFFLMLVFPSCS